jgi:ParB family transcriptional regulator, chromosome partitioning protein
MANKLKEAMQAAKDIVKSGQGETATTSKKSLGIVESRVESAKKFSSGDRATKALYKVDPTRSRMWVHHNREYSRLDENNCADLIEGFRAMGQQEFPAIARLVKGDKQYDYEIICGARRHWTASYLGWKLLIEVRDLSDEEAFRLADVENRDRQDISDLERARDYRNALVLFYDDNKKQMATRLEVSENWLFKLLVLAELPQTIVDAYADIADIKERHARALSPLLKDTSKKAMILEKAEQLASIQKAEKESGGQMLAGDKVIAQLKAAASSPLKQKSNKLAEKKYSNGKAMLSLERKGRASLLMTIKTNSGASKTELMTAIEEALGNALE